MINISAILKGMLMPNGIMISSNYDITWQQVDNGQLRGLDFLKDGIRAFDFDNNELNKLLEKDFTNVARYPHAIGGYKLAQLGELLSHPSRYSSYESILDANAVRATSFLDVFSPT
ncbi:hypothetical protein CJF42_06445 [Pseudoalteromonas sp. NBT06-2]|uniref:hypothetical protein n=1 Tax=Pseudoalteromonas sp. NBT06-2 TaxID=2025950 RepID=UPI000BA6BA51|nr:hypothetical protein [Pseudoalteromonas sp. NBT06-2]PAJ75126.1 hypothetical protein CJF42_06445 [Pseudoalteromonas sp. NBT06-2]